MNLIAIIAALFAERFLGMLDEYRQFQWLGKYADLVKQRAEKLVFLDGVAGVLLVVLLPALVVQYIYAQLDDIFVLFGFGFAILILIAGFGPKRFYDTIKALIDAKNSANADNLHFQVEKLLGREVSEKSVQSLVQLASREILVLVNERIFAVLFWFLILGPLGVVFYRLAAELNAREDRPAEEHAKGFAQTAEKLLFVLNWVPVRLLAFSYAIMGNFIDGMSVLKNAGSDDGDKLLADVGVKSINLLDEDSSCIERSFGLVRRSLVLWVGFIAVLTISGWVG